jgi:type I restriction enzyme M protein
MYNEIKKKLTLDFISRLKDAYGYKESQIDYNVKLKSGFVADIAIWANKQAKEEFLEPKIYVLVVCRSEHIRINADYYFENFEGASLSNTTFYVAHNMKETKVYYLKKEKYTPKVLRVSDFPKAEDISSPDKLRNFIERIEKNTIEDFLYQLSTCHNIIRNNDKLSPEASFDEISKVLFIKMMYESNPANDQELTFTLSEFLRKENSYKKNSKGNFIDYLFESVKERYKEDNVFDKRDVIRIKRESFLSIIETLQNINLYDSNEDVKGVAFESFLGKTFRGELGQFFTPRSIVNYMIHVLDIKEGEIVGDPCCGSGGFLISAFDYVQHKIDKDIQNQIDHLLKSDDADKYDKIKLLQEEFNKNKVGSRYYKLCHNYFFGTDANARMARISKMNMIMHGDGHVGVYLHDGLINVGGMYDGRFDVILVNPPFGAHIGKNIKYLESDMPESKEINKYLKIFGKEYQEKVVNVIKENVDYVNPDGTIGKPIISTFDVRDERSEILFLERCLQLLKPGGRAGIVLPEGILNNKNNEKIREYVESKAKILNITSIPYDVFQSSGASIKPSLLFIQKYEKSLDNKDNYVLSVTKVDDAGITSTGARTKNSQLPVAEKEVSSWINHKILGGRTYSKIVNRADFPMWNISSLFEDSKVKYNNNYPIVSLSEVLVPQKQLVKIEDNQTYKRVRVRLYNQGVELRDTVLGSSIGTRRQYIVRTGQFVISKIDGKSGAFGIIPIELDGAIVTPDFLVFDIIREKINDDYLQLIMNSEQFLTLIRTNSSGTTHRQRVSLDVLMNAPIALPTLSEQESLVEAIEESKKKMIKLKKDLSKETENFYKNIFKK